MLLEGERKNELLNKRLQTTPLAGGLAESNSQNGSFPGGSTESIIPKMEVSQANIFKNDVAGS